MLKPAGGTPLKSVLLLCLQGGKEVLVKRLDRALACSGRDFRREVDALGRVAHPNLVKLIGYCMDDGMHMLVYEWLDNGTLYDHLHGENSWIFALYDGLLARCGSGLGDLKILTVSPRAALTRPIESWSLKR